MRALVVTWAPGGNLPPLLAAASVLGRRGHDVALLASGETRGAAERLGFEVTGYRRSADPDPRIAFEAQAQATMATMAGADIALDARDAVEELGADLAIVDCMLPAAIAGARATGTPTASLVHFLYGLARTRMLQGAGGWTSDLEALAATHRLLGLAPVLDGLSAWEAPELVLVTAPRWLDVEAGAPDHVVHAGPLNVDALAGGAHRAGADPPRVLLSFSTTVMEGQVALIDRVSEAIAGLEVDAVLTLGHAVDLDAVHVPVGVEVLPFADHDRLMPGCAAVISHAGLGTVLRAFAHGVPQLLLALGRDQPFNADRVEQLEAGIRLPADAPPQRIRTALDALLTGGRYRAAAERLANRIAAENPDRTAAEALERIARRLPPNRPPRRA
jgi:UDP:flavonoid glycosyltransferase YjiC (YdhE family)